VNGVFEQVAAITEKESNEHLLPTRFLNGASPTPLAPHFHALIMLLKA
jgi:hypothetical protein